MLRYGVLTWLDHRLLDARGAASGGSLERDADARLEAGRTRAILCCACGAHITDSTARIEVSGQHRHTFFNPAGLIFQVACFARVPGCVGAGRFTDEFSWFAQHRWQLALCGGCRAHLGWHFAGASTFCALIERRITEADA